MSITSGGVRTLFSMEGNRADPDFKPIVQAIQVKAVGNPNGAERYRVVLSDGEHFIQGLLATQLNHLVHEGKLQTNALIRIKEFMNNMVQHRTVIILLDIDVVNGDHGQRVGAPVEVDSAVTPNAQPSAPAQPMFNRTNVPANAMHKTEPSNNSSNPYGSSRNQQNSYNRPSYTPQTSSSAPIVRSNPMGGSPYTLISALNMYQNRWKIKARVSSKSDIRTWSNARGEGSLFSVELLDSSGTDIRATFFKEAVDKFFPLLTEGKVYSFAGGRLKVANAQYNTCKSNLEVTFDDKAEIHLEDDIGNIARQNYDFSKISQIEETEAGKMVDVLAVVKVVGEPTALISKKTGQELIKCDLVLGDDSGTEVSLTLWGEKATKASNDFANTPVVAFRRARVSDFNGKSLSLSGSADINPMYLPEAQRLQQWWNQGGASSTVKSLSSSMGGGKIDAFKDRKDIGSIKAEEMGRNEKPDWLSFKATISFLKKDKEGGAWYPACSNAGDPCKNMYKVTQTVDGQWYCDKCQGTYQSCVRRWIFSGTVEDPTASTWVSFFNEQAEALLGEKADDAFTKYMEHNQDQDGYDSLFARAEHTEWLFKCKVKSEIVNQESRVKTSVYALQPVDYLKESLDMLDMIDKF